VSRFESAAARHSPPPAQFPQAPTASRRLPKLIQNRNNINRWKGGRGGGLAIWNWNEGQINKRPNMKKGGSQPKGLPKSKSIIPLSKNLRPLGKKKENSPIKLRPKN
jgi:hypothetical protein